MVASGPQGVKRIDVQCNGCQSHTEPPSLSQTGSNGWESRCFGMPVDFDLNMKEAWPQHQSPSKQLQTSRLTSARRASASSPSQRRRPTPPCYDFQRFLPILGRASFQDKSAITGPVLPPSILQVSTDSEASCNTHDGFAAPSAISP